MHKRTTQKILGRAKELHRNLTPAEVKLWTRLRAHRMAGVHFRNQHAIGKYVVDFCAPRKKLIIELDGSQPVEQEEYAIQYEQPSSSRKVIESCGFGTTM